MLESLWEARCDLATALPYTLCSSAKLFVFVSRFGEQEDLCQVVGKRDCVKHEKGGIDFGLTRPTVVCSICPSFLAAPLLPQQRKYPGLSPTAKPQRKAPNRYYAKAPDPGRNVKGNPHLKRPRAAQSPTSHISSLLPLRDPKLAAPFWNSPAADFGLRMRMTDNAG